MLNIETTDQLPPVRRGGGRPSQERKQIQDALVSGEIQVVKDVEAGNKYNASQTAFVNKLMKPKPAPCFSLN